MVQSYSRVAKTDRMVSCTGPLPFYTAAQYTDMKAASVIPLSLALFVTSFFLVTLVLGGKKLLESTNPKLIFCVGSAAVYCCLDLLPMVAFSAFRRKPFTNALECVAFDAEQTVNARQS
jgi:hypothetical protein